MSKHLSVEDRMRLVLFVDGGGSFQQAANMLEKERGLSITKMGVHKLYAKHFYSMYCIILHTLSKS